MSFTVYPPGHVPYGRKAIAPVAQDGEMAFSSDDERPPGRLAWEQTLFAAAFDAANGDLWAIDQYPWTFEQDPAVDPRRRTTQRRRVFKAARIVGADPTIGDSDRLAIAEELGVPGLRLRDAAVRFDRAGGLQDRACVITDLVRELRPRRSLVNGLLVAGHVAGQWGRPIWWAPSRAGPGSFRSLV
jgi:hypothetical protein